MVLQKCFRFIQALYMFTFTKMINEHSYYIYRWTPLLLYILSLFSDTKPKSSEKQDRGNYSMKTMKPLNTMVVVAITVLIGMFGSSEAQLQMNFYAKSCPNAEKIISDYIQKHIHNGPSLAAPLIRMHFHDCFVRVFI